MAFWNRSARAKTGQLPRGAVSAVTATALAVFRDENNGVHAETAIAAMAGVAGTLVLRNSAGGMLDRLEAGSALFGDDADVAGQELLHVVMKAASDVGVQWDTASGTAVPEVHQPRASAIELGRLLEPRVGPILAEHKIERSLWPQCCGLAGLDLVMRARDVLDTEIGTRIFVGAFVAGTKTVPYSRS